MKKKLLPLLAIASSAVLLAGCAQSGGAPAPGADSILIGTTDKVVALDPAGSYDLGSSVLQNQVFAWLLTSKPGETTPSPDLAETAEFTAPDEYTVKLREGLTFANGHELTASDVKFSFDRQQAIADAQGPSTLLSDLVETTVTDDLTVVFHLATPDNALWEQVLTGPAASIVDEEVFAADALTPETDIVAGDAFSGAYRVTTFDLNNIVAMEPNEAYDGLLGSPKNAGVIISYFADQSNLKLAVQEGEVDLAYRSLSATDVEDLSKRDGLTVHSGPGGEMRFITFSMTTMPFGSATAEADEKKALAVRQAVADLIDRETISSQVYKGTYEPAYTQVPSGLPGSVDAFKELYGDGNGGPDVDAATARLAAAGVATPVVLNLQYNSDHYGASSSEEYALVKSQLEESGLFTVNLQSTEWTQYVGDFSEGLYPAYQLGWFSDYPDTDNYINLFYGTPESPSLLGAASENAELNALVSKERTMAPGAERDAVMAEAQQIAASYIPTIPLLQGSEIVIASEDIAGIEDTLDASFRFRFGMLSK